MRVLVTGATGFIGRHLVDRLAGSHEVIAASRSGGRVAGAVSVARLDLAAHDVDDTLPGELDAVVHLAAAIVETADNSYLTTNVAGTAAMLRYAERAGAGIFVHGSTGGVYGPGPRPFVETDTMRPVDPYAISKAQAEIAVAAAPVNTVRLRYAFPYGLGTPNAISGILRAVLAGEPVNVVEGMRPRCNPIYVDDAVELTARCLTRPVDACLNIAGTELATFADIAVLAGELAGRPARLRLVPLARAHPYYTDDAVLDAQLAYHQLGYVPQIPITEGVARLVEAMSAV